MIVKIYKLVNDVNDEVYIGHTEQTLKKRFSEHKGDKYLYDNCAGYLYILAYSNASIELIEEIEVEDKDEARYFEQLFIDEYKDKCWNISTAYRKISKDEQNEIYHNKDPERWKQYLKNYNSKKIKCEICGLEMRNDSKYKHNKSFH